MPRVSTLTPYRAGDQGSMVRATQQQRTKQYLTLLQKENSKLGGGLSFKSPPPLALDYPSQLYAS